LDVVLQQDQSSLDRDKAKGLGKAREASSTNLVPLRSQTAMVLFEVTASQRISQ